MIRTLPITKAREELTTLVDKARKLLDEYIITVNGSPAAVLMSAAEYESWKETIEILSDKKLMRSISYIYRKNSNLSGTMLYMS